MNKPQDIAVQKKKELSGKGESTVPTRYFVPPTDIYETEDALTIVMEVPGVDKANLTATVEEGVLRVEGRIDFGHYEAMEPVYAEYNIGHWQRSFTLSSKLAPDGISAELADGVLTLTLRKAEEAQPRSIPIR